MKAKREVAALPWRMYLLVGCVGVIISGMVGYGLHAGIQLDARHIPLHEATMQLMIDATTSHLLFEEIISGDRHEDIEEVWEYLRRTEQLMQFMLEGGEIPEGTIVPLDDEQMRRQIEDARRVLAEYCKITRQRIIAFESSLPGTEIDQLSDSLFAAFMDKAENVEVQLHQLMAGDLDRFRAIQIILVVVSFLLALLVGLVLHRHLRRHIQDMQAIRLVKDDLEKDITERKRAEEKLRESEERYRAIAEDTPVLICRFLPSGEITYANEAYCKYFAKTSEELVGQTFLSLIPVADRETVMAGISALTIDSPIQTHEHRVIAPGGEIQWQRWTNRALFDAAGRAVAYQSVGEDMTERKQVEIALRQNEESMRVLLDAAPDVIHLLDADGIVISTNQGFAGRVGKDVNEIVGRCIYDFHQPDSVPQRKAAVDRVFQTGKPFHMVDESTTKVYEAHVHPVFNPEGKVNAVAVYARDITERRRAEEALRESEAKYRNLVETMNEGLIVHDEHANIQYVNDRMCKIWGYMADELVGRNAMEIAVESTRTMMHDQWARRGRGETEPYETVLKHKDGHIVPIFVSPQPILGLGGSFEGSFSVITDITERKQAEDALRNSQEAWKTTFDAMTDWVSLIDPKTHTIISTNRAGEEVTGLPVNEIVGNKCHKMIHNLDGPPSDCPVQRLLKSKNREETEIKLGEDGPWILVSVDPVFDENTQIVNVVHIVKDITKRKRAEKLTHLQRDLAYTLGRTIDLNEALSHCLTAALDATGMDAGGVYLVDQKTRCLDLPISSGLPQGFVASASHFDADSPNARLIMKGKPIYSLHHKIDTMADKSRLQEGLRAVAAIPVSHEGKIIACLHITSHTLNDLPQAARGMAEAIANQMGGAITRIQAEEALKQAHGQLELRVKERTLELSQANKDLKREILVRKRIEKKLREHQTELQTLASELSLAEERERRRFAANLHDTISQNLVMAHMKLESLTVDKLPDEVSASIKQANQMVGEALESTQTLTFELSPPVLHRLGLGPAVESLGDRMHQLHGLKVELVDQGPTEPLTEDLGAFLFRATRELLINVVKHAKTEHVKVTVKKIRSTIQVEVEDQGVGFVHADTKVGRRHGEGFGLFSIQERLIRLGGSLKIWSEPGQGTRIAMSAPLKTAGKTAEETRV